MNLQVDDRNVVVRKSPEPFSAVLTPAALRFVAKLHREFDTERTTLLRLRDERQEAFDAGAVPGFLAKTQHIRDSAWNVAQTPSDLEDRRVEITGPVDRKMTINALNSGARVFMADFEDSLSPTWENVVHGQINMRDAVRRSIEFENPDGRKYQLNANIATLVVRPRGWHLCETNVLVDGDPMSASLFDFGMYFFHNARELLERGSGPYFYLPKLESHLEARLWSKVFSFAEKELGIPSGSVRATVLIETILAAFEMDEILYELRDYAAGLNAGRWDYIFSAIKVFRNHADKVQPDRSQVTMTVPFMRAYTELLVKTCHRRRAHAIGGMAAFIPSRDSVVNDIAMAKVREDKERESRSGFDGTWVAHPALVALARDVFDDVLGASPNQILRLREDVTVKAEDLSDVQVPGGTITEDGLRNNVNVSLQYINAWLQGVGAAAINNMMEDAATAEISRAQLWQWIQRDVVLEDGRPVTPELYRAIRQEELTALGGARFGSLGTASSLLDVLVLDDELAAFLTLPAYEVLIKE